MGRITKSKIGAIRVPTKWILVQQKNFKKNLVGLVPTPDVALFRIICMSKQKDLDPWGGGRTRGPGSANELCNLKHMFPVLWYLWLRCAAKLPKIKCQLYVNPDIFLGKGFTIVENVSLQSGSHFFIKPIRKGAWCGWMPVGGSRVVIYSKSRIHSTNIPWKLFRMLTDAVISCCRWKWYRRTEDRLIRRTWVQISRLSYKSPPSVPQLVRTAYCSHISQREHYYLPTG